MVELAVETMGPSQDYVTFSPSADSKSGTKGKGKSRTLIFIAVMVRAIHLGLDATIQLLLPLSTPC